jgi:effector-binding domain-containing protein
LRPERTDPQTGYRAYSVGQLARLQRLLALRDLGFSLDQIGPWLDRPPSVEQLRGMLELRKAQIEQSVAQELEQLRRVDAYLRRLETPEPGPPLDVVIKQTQALRILESSAQAGALTPAALAPVFDEVIPRVAAELGRSKLQPGTMIAYYDEPADDGSVVVHAGFAIEGTLQNAGELRVVDLPIVSVASVVHRGSMDQCPPVYEALLRYIEDSGYRPAAYSRELYLEIQGRHDPRNVTELQVPITRSA